MRVIGSRNYSHREQCVELTIEKGTVVSIGWQSLDWASIFEPARRDIRITDPDLEKKVRGYIAKLDLRPTPKDGYIVYTVVDNKDGVVEVWCNPDTNMFHFMVKPLVSGGIALSRLFTTAYRITGVDAITRLVVLKDRETLSEYCLRQKLQLPEEAQQD